MSQQPETYEYFQRLHEEGNFLDEDDKTAKSQVMSRLIRVLHWSPSDRDTDESMMSSLFRCFMAWAESFNNVQDKEGSIPGGTRGLRQLVYYSMAKVCYWDWVDDTEMVAIILRNIYDCDAHFSGLYLQAIEQGERLVGHWKWRTRTSEMKQYSVLLYFVHHASIAKLKYDGRPFVDVSLLYPMPVAPVIVSCLCNRPRPLLLLLRFGAKLKTGNPIDTWAVFNDGDDDWDISLLLRHLLRILWTCFGHEMQSLPPSTTMLASNTMQNVILCLKILLRVIRQIDFCALDFSLMTFENGRLSGTVLSQSFIQWLSDESIIPTLVSRYYRPSNLLHLCRFEIRRILNSLCSLPYAIYELPLPRILQKYLDLDED